MKRFIVSLFLGVVVGTFTMITFRYLLGASEFTTGQWTGILSTIAYYSTIEFFEELEK